MNAADHKREAERLLDEVRGNNTNPMITYAEDAAQIAAAHVHALLATIPDPVALVISMGRKPKAES